MTIDADQFATLCAFQEFPIEECVPALMEDYGLSEADAREKANAAYRQRQEVAITDTHDDMEDRA
jgi:hypothetical protein